MRMRQETRKLIRYALIAFLAGLLSVTTAMHANAEEMDSSSSVPFRAETDEECSECIRILPNGEKIAMHRYSSCRYLEPTRISSGYMTYTCDICGQTVREIFPPLKTYTCSVTREASELLPELFEDEGAAFTFDRPGGARDE